MLERQMKREKAAGILKPKIYDFKGNEIETREEFNGKESGSDHTK